MDFPAIPATTTITVFTRHAPDCPKFADRYWRRCNCRKALYIYEGGADKIVSARTRSWEQAEKLAKAERDLRDPIRRKLQEIEDKEAQRAALRKSKNITVSDATDRWLRSQRWKSKETETIYRCAASRINTWAADTGVNSLPDITADMLHEGRGFWSSSAKKKYNRIGLTSQSAFLGYLKRFFRYAVRIELLARNPAQELTPISKSKRRTQVLTSWWRSALSQDRERFLPDYFLWEKGVSVDYLSTKWAYSVRKMNAYTDLKDQQGKPMRFHTHMLRDTFAVELLLAGVPLEDVSKLLNAEHITPMSPGMILT